jgi:uncharacterized protein
MISEWLLVIDDFQIGVAMIRALTCPICGRECGAVGRSATSEVTDSAEKSYLPFCSQRCQQVDFQRWWQGKYAVVEEVDLTNLPPDVDVADENVE